jgi:hypothetical protein
MAALLDLMAELEHPRRSEETTDHLGHRSLLNSGDVRSRLEHNAANF